MSLVAGRAACFAALALTSAAGLQATDAGLARAIEKAISRPSLARASWAIEVLDPRSRRVLFAREAQRNLKPASTMKLFVTAAALEAFGPDHRFRTTVETAGRLDRFGRILGDLYLVGGGDTNLGWKPAEGQTRTAFEELADSLKQAGVRRVEGRVVGHDGAFRGDRRGDDWGWEDLTWGYGAEVSALSFADNCALLTVSPGERPGDPVRLEAAPRSRYFTVSSTAVTAPASTKAELSLARDPGGNHIRLGGTLAIGSADEILRVALEDPARYAATVFAETLEARGIALAGPVAATQDPLPGNLRVLATHEGPPMAELIAGVNKPSQNLYTEMLLRLLGLRVRGEGSVTAGHEALAGFLSRAGIDPTQPGLRDGSGLSRSDLLTAGDLVRLLAFMDRHPLSAPFKSSLPIAGVDGTLRARLKGTPAEGRVLAKTGSLRGVSALAGYARTLRGEERIFAILCNNFTADSREAVAAIDEVVLALVSR